MSTIRLEFWHGRPGSGKGTQIVQRRKDFPGAAIVYPGQILRDAQQPGHPYYERVAPYAAATNKGAIAIPRKVVGEIVEEEVKRHIINGVSVILLDGLRYRNTQKRAVATVQKRGIHVNEQHIFLAVPGKIACERLRKGSRSRQDDNAINRRMRSYLFHTVPMLLRLQMTRKLHKIDGVGTVEEVHQRVRRSVR